jgi:putative membrane protein
LLAAKGFAVGVANVVPGISGATLAVIFRVYDRLIAAINGLTTDFKKSLRFLIPFGLGMALGIVVSGSVISILIRMFSFQSAGFIAGLMGGSIPFLYGTATAKLRENHRKSVLVTYYTAAGAAALVVALLAVFVPTPELYVEGSLGFGAMALLFAGGLLAAAAMVIPGVSGAMVLILLGIYPLAMDTINRIREYAATPFSFGLLPPILQIVIPIGLGVIPGILLASKGIALLLERYFSLTYFIIIGLVLGTVFALFADPHTYQSGEVTALSVVTAAVAFIIGVSLALLLGKKKE